MSTTTETPRQLNLFERQLTLWVGLCIVGGILLGRIAPGVAKALDDMAVYVGGAPVVSIPIAICLFFMMYPIMVKIDFVSVVRAGRSAKPVLLTLFVAGLATGGSYRPRDTGAPGRAQAATAAAE